ncbi:unnamed protein product [Trichobilharzia szidati]|nr:unnamed protein product [Trichobilharzia szidati]
MNTSSPIQIHLDNGSYKTTTPSEISSVDYNYILGIAYVFVQTTICSIGFILNLVNFSVFICRKFSASAYILMTVLSLADAITLGVRIPQGCIFLPHLSHHATDAAIYIYMYSIYVETPVSNMTENISAWLTVVLAIERYVSMKHWSLSKRYFTRRNTRQLIGVICIVAFIFNIPYFAIQTVSLKQVNGVLELRSDFTEFSRSTYYAFYSWLRIVCVQIIPLCFLCLSNCLLFILVSQHNRRFSGRPNSNVENTQKNLSGKNFKGRNISESQIQADFASQDRCVDSCKLYSSQKSHKSSSQSSPLSADADVQTLSTKSNEIELSCRNENNNNNDSVKSKEITSKLRSKRRQNTQLKLTILLIGVILLFLTGQVPQALAYVRVFTTLGVCSMEQIQTCVAYQMYRMITINLAQFAFASTFFLYLFLNRDFRETLRYTYCHFCPFCLKQNDSGQRAPRETNYISEQASNYHKI